MNLVVLALYSDVFGAIRYIHNKYFGSSVSKLLERLAIDNTIMHYSDRINVEDLTYRV
jgi:hypothetical protein